MVQNITSAAVSSCKGKNSNDKVLTRIAKINVRSLITIKGGYRRAEKSRKVLMMMKAAKRDLAEPEPEPGAGRRRVGVGQDQSKSRAEAGAGEE